MSSSYKWAAVVNAAAWNVKKQTKTKQNKTKNASFYADIKLSYGLSI